MSTEFRESRLKIEWANHHIAKLEERIAELPERCTAVMKMDSAGIHEVIEYDLPNATEHATQIALIIGDAIHNLRCALDYAWVSVLEKVAPSAIDGSTKFPVRESLQELEAALHGKKIDTLAPRLYDRITLNIRPYKGGNLAAWPIHRITACSSPFSITAASPALTWMMMWGSQRITVSPSAEPSLFRIMFTSRQVGPSKTKARFPSA